MTVGYVRANATTKAQAIIDLLEDVLTKQGSWTKVDTIGSPGAMPCSVWECAGTRNDLQRNWYLLIARTAVNPEYFYLAVAEGFNPSERWLLWPAPGTGAPNAVPASDGTYGGGTVGYRPWVGLTGNTLNSVDFFWYSVHSGSASSGGYSDAWAFVNETFIAVATAQPNDDSGRDLVIAGVAEPFRSDDPGILYITKGTDGRVTRQPATPYANTYNWQIGGFGSSLSNWTPAIGTVMGAGDRFFDNRPIAARRVVRHKGSSQINGALRGLFKGLITVPVAFTAGSVALINPADFIIVDSDQYMWPGTNPGSMWLNKDLL